MWTAGRFLGTQNTGLVQLIGDADVEFHIDHGFSGTPLWDDDLGSAVAGMVVAKEQAAYNEQGARTAYAVLAGTLLRIWPELCLHARPPCPFRGLQAFREQDRDGSSGGSRPRSSSSITSASTRLPARAGAFQIPTKSVGTR